MTQPPISTDPAFASAPVPDDRVKPATAPANRWTVDDSLSSPPQPTGVVNTKTSVLPSGPVPPPKVAQPLAPGSAASRTQASTPNPSLSPSTDLIGDYELPPAATDRWRLLPAWLVSSIVHTLLLVCLVLIPLSVKRSGGSVWFASLTDRDESTEVTIETLPTEEQPSEDSTPREQPYSVDTTALNHSQTIQLPSVFAARTQSSDALPSYEAILAAPAGMQSLQELPSGGFHRRDAESRQRLGAMYGATEQSEDAVEAALAWLAAHQQRNGSWSFDLSKEPCNGRCRHNQKEGADFARPATAATGLALLAFLGAGYSHQEGKYAETVQRGLYFLRDSAMPTDFGLDLQSGSMYGHGIAAMAISEAMALVRYNGREDHELFALTEQIASFTSTAQHRAGGWRYVPGSPGDMTVSGWQILSLISAQHGGVVLPTGTLPLAQQFIRSLSKPDAYQFGYQSQRPEPRTTAIGLCLLLYLGQTPGEPPFAASLDALAARGPRLTDVYYDYYATLALHHARHRDWASWHVPLREHLIKTQSQNEHEAGSWHFKDENGDVGGRLYTTAMAAMILEVYYRYLPLYQSRGEFRLN